MTRKRSAQENFWAGEFGVSYIDRNNEAQIVAGNVALFSKALSRCSELSSVIEFGANIGLNLRALRTLFPDARLSGVEINPEAASILRQHIGPGEVFEGSILDYRAADEADLVLVKGVLIHISPELLADVYQKMYEASRKYILLCEYYNPTPVTVSYRGHENRLFKRDFAGDLLEGFPDLQLVDYGFVYKRDPAFPLDDITWFLLEKGE